MLKTKLLAAACVVMPMTSFANVITDWDEKAVNVIQPATAPQPPRVGPSGALRILAIMHCAMFDVVNAVEPRYKPYMGKITLEGETSQDAAAASAAANVLITLHPESATTIKNALETYLAAIPDGEPKSRGMKLGETTAAKAIEARLKDGNDAAYDYRPATQPGMYVPTIQTVSWEYVAMKPFAMTSPDQFRPGPPIALTSDQWAKDYNEIKDVGEKNSKHRTEQQTEIGRFWLTTGPLASHPLARQIALKKQMSVVDSARFMAVVSAAETDAAIAVFDAKYQYRFWRPITAIRNGDMDDNPATERVAGWQPLDATPMHPEYPCAHCIISSSVAGVVETLLGSTAIPEVSFTTPTAPAGVKHSFTNMDTYADEVANARIYAGFHYRFSTEVGKDMGRKIGAYTARSVMSSEVAQK